MGRNKEFIFDLKVTESKSAAGDGILKELNKHSQQKEGGTSEDGNTIGEHVKKCRRAK